MTRLQLSDIVDSERLRVALPDAFTVTQVTSRRLAVTCGRRPAVILLTLVEGWEPLSHGPAAWRVQAGLYALPVQDGRVRYLESVSACRQYSGVEGDGQDVTPLVAADVKTVFGRIIPRTHRGDGKAPNEGKDQS